MSKTTATAIPGESGARTLSGLFVEADFGESRRLAELLPALRARPNVLIDGPARDADQTFERMRPYLRTPLATWAPRETPWLPTGTFRTLVIRDVDSLNPSQQESVARFISRAAGRVQVVSIAGTPLFPLVTCGAFQEHLYYRLNTVLFEHPPAQPRRLQRSHGHLAIHRINRLRQVGAEDAR
jgi:sigma-54-interacting transcriptional regulator